MNAPNLSRRIASSIVDGLKARGRILVVKGGTAALVRAVDESMASELERLSPIPGPRALPPTQQAQDSEAAQTPERMVERMVDRVVGALLGSEHLEDVFADRSVVRREVEGAVRAALSEAREKADEANVHVRLDLLGYVASTAGKRAPEGTLREALERAGHLAGARLAGYDAEARTAMFLPEVEGDPDLRLTLEEAVADELTALIETGQVELPTLERRVALEKDVSPDLRPGLRRRIELAATRTLRRTGCAASWEFEGPRALRVTFTPMSEQDAREMDTHLSQFAREVNAALADLPARLPEPPPMMEARPANGILPPSPPPALEARPAGRALPPDPRMPSPRPRIAEPMPEVEEVIPPTMQTPVMPPNGWGTEAAAPSEVASPPAEEPAAPRVRTTKRATRSSTRPPPAPRTAAAKRTPTKRAATKRTTTGAEEPVRKKAATKAKRTVAAAPKARKAPAKKRSS